MCFLTACHLQCASANQGLPLSDSSRCVQTDAKAAEASYETAMDKVKDLEQQLKEAKARAEEARRAAAEASHKAEDAEDEANSRIASAERAVRVVSSCHCSRPLCIPYLTLGRLVVPGIHWLGQALMSSTVCAMHCRGR